MGEARIQCRCGVWPVMCMQSRFSLWFALSPIAPSCLASPHLTMSLLTDSDLFAGRRRDTRDALNRELRNDHAYQQALREMDAIEQAELAGGGRVRCEACGAPGLLPSLLADHQLVCPHGLCACPLSCGAAPMPRSQLWLQHLRGECRRYVIHCSSFRCKRNEQPPQVGAPEVASQAAASASSSAASSSACCPTSASSAPRDLVPLSGPGWSMDCTGCNVIRGGPNSPHLHYPSDRAAFEESQRVLSPIDLPASLRNPAGAHLRVCPCCAQRMLVANSPDVGAADELSLMDVSPPFGLPYHNDTYLSQEWRSSWYYRATSVPRDQRTTYKHQTRALAISQAAAETHVQRCYSRRAEAEAAASAAAAANGSSPAASPSVSASSSCPPSSDFRSDDCGIYKYQPRFAECGLGVIPPHDTVTTQPPHAPPKNALVGLQTGIGAAVSEGGVPFVLSWSSLLAQTLLLRVSLDPNLPSARQSRGLCSSSSHSSASLDVAAVAEQLFVHGANLSDLLLMYDKSGEMHRSLRPMSSMQRRHVDPAALSDALSPLQRPLVLPLLTPHLIPDLAKMVLQYF